MIRVVKLMIRKINWLAWLVLVVVWNYGFPEATPFQDVIVAVFLSILFTIIHPNLLRDLQNLCSRSKFEKLMKRHLLWEFITIINLQEAIKP